MVGLNLCPFAKAVQARGQVHYAVCEAADPAAVLAALDREVEDLLALDAAVRDTTLLVLTGGLQDFLEFNDLLGEAEWRLSRQGLEGVLQLASFHPAYQFAGTEAGDITNATNRSPWPTLHLLREDSIDRAVEAFPDAEAIYGRNMETLEHLGEAGWRALDVGAGAASRAAGGGSGAA